MSRFSSLLKPFTVIVIVIYFLYLATRLDSVLERYLLLSIALFSTGIYGITASRNAIRVLMSIELLLNAANVSLLSFSSFMDPMEIKGQIFAIFVMAIAAAEAAVALAIVLAIYRNLASVDMEDFAELKW